jgi:carboxymethylenebutenolidase
MAIAGQADQRFAGGRMPSTIGAEPYVQGEQQQCRQPARDPVTRSSLVLESLALVSMIASACGRFGSAAATTVVPPARWEAAITQPRVRLDTLRLSDGADTFTAYVGHPRGAGPHAGVIVIHANRLTEPYIASTAAMLAEAGFTAMAVDVFHFLPGNETWTASRQTPGDSVNAALARGFRERRLLSNIQAGVRYLRQQPGVTGGVALLGFCGGGWNALLVAAQSADVGAVVAFYAPVAQSDAQHRAPLDLVPYIRVPVLYHHPKHDQWVPTADVDRFEAALRAEHTPLQRVDYDAPHGFFAWNREGVFVSSDASRAWQITVPFLRRYAGQPLVERPLAPARTSALPSVEAPDRATSAEAMHLLHQTH